MAYMAGARVTVKMTCRTPVASLSYKFNNIVEQISRVITPCTQSKVIQATRCWMKEGIEGVAVLYLLY